MRSPALAQTLPPALAREKALLAGEVEKVLGARPSPERPGALREAIEPDPRMAGVLPSTKGAL